MLTSLTIVMLASVTLQMLLVAVTAAWRPAGNIYGTIVIVCLITAPLAFIADRLLLAQVFDRDARVFLVLIHLALGGFFFHFMTLPDRSVTLRILVELLVAPGQVLTADALGRRYGVSTMILRGRLSDASNWSMIVDPSRPQPPVTSTFLSVKSMEIT